VPAPGSAVDARQLLVDRLGLPVLDAETGLRESYALAYGAVPGDLGEYEQVLTELRKDGITAKRPTALRASQRPAGGP
jgi:hypothetical protein